MSEHKDFGGSAAACSAGEQPATAPDDVTGQRERFYFTFGWGQPWAGRFHVIEAENWEAAREKMVERFGLKWGFQYDESQWVSDGVSQETEYGLTEIR